jgi:transcriptional regulator with XRE-family HTH domain
MQKSYGEYIRNEREKRNLSQRELSELTKSTPPGVSKGTIKNIESGNNARPSTRRLIESTLNTIPVSIYHEEKTSQTL